MPSPSLCCFAAATTAELLEACAGWLGDDSRSSSVRDGGQGAARIRIPPQPLQVGANLRGVLVAQVAILFESLVDNVFKARRQIGIEAEHGSRRPIQNGLKDRRRTFSAEGHGARRHFVEDGSKGKQIGAAVEVFAPGLLRRHVGDGADGGAGAGQVLIVDRMGRGIVQTGSGSRSRQPRRNLGKAEVENLGVIAIGDENVRRLDVAMHDASGVRGVERVGDFDRQRQDLRRFHGTARRSCV